MPFDLARRFTNKHIIPQPSDLELNPPESYLYIQDGLIISCGVLYALCYFFYAIRTYRDRHLSGSVLYLAGTMAYEIYYAAVMPQSNFEQFCFFVWFLFDVSFAAVAIKSAYPPEIQRTTVKRLVTGVIVGLAFFHAVVKVWPDELEQKTAYWTGAILELPIGCGHLYLLLTTRSTKGQSLEMWITRYLGCWTAFGVFIWRYLNVPENWAYVRNPWSVGIIVVTLLSETVYPFVYLWARGQENKVGKMKTR